MNSEGMLSDNPKAGIHLTDVARTVSTNGGNPGNWQGGDVIVGHATESCYGISRSAMKGGMNAGGMPVMNDCQPTIQANGPGAVSYLCLNDMEGGYFGVSHQAGTLRAQEHGHQPVVCMTACRVYDCRGNGDGKTVSTLTGDHGNRVTDYTAILVCEENSNE